MSLEKQILVIEEDAQIRELLCEVLETEGYRVLETNDASRGLAILRTEKGISLVLLDLIKNGMTSQVFMKHLTCDAQLSDVPVLLISADSKIKGIAQDLGVTDYIRKPVSMDDLLEAVARTQRIRWNL